MTDDRRGNADQRPSLIALGVVVVAFAACVLFEHAQAQAQQFVPPPPPPVPAPPPPVLNPIPPNTTVPQPSYKPISPATPSTGPGYSVSPVEGRLPPTAVRAHEGTSAAKTVHRRRRSVVARTAPEPYSSWYYYSPFAYDYGCAWRRSWDGYWFRTSPCS